MEKKQNRKIPLGKIKINDSFWSEFQKLVTDDRDSVSGKDFK